MCAVCSCASAAYVCASLHLFPLPAHPGPLVHRTRDTCSHSFFLSPRPLLLPPFPSPSCSLFPLLLSLRRSLPPASLPSTPTDALLATRPPAPTPSHNPSHNVYTAHCTVCVYRVYIPCVCTVCVPCVPCMCRVNTHRHHSAARTKDVPWRSKIRPTR